MTRSALFAPLRIGGISVPNRIMQAAHSKQYSDRVESARETAYFVRRARGGCGLFIAGNRFVHPSGSIRGFQDAFRPEAESADRRMTDAIHDAGAKVFVQLNHHGAQAMPDGPDGPRAVYAPSRILSPSTAHATREMSIADIREFTDAWATSAEIAQRGGFDGVEIHVAHGYLLHQFLSPLYNARTDGYGGDLAGRTRFAREVLAAVRERVGDEFVVGIRIVANEFHPQGMDAAALREAIAMLRASTRIDFIDLAAGGYHNVHYVFPSAAMPYAWLRDEVAAVKAANPEVPVFGVGAALSLEEAEEVVRVGIADMVALTRAQIADPDLALKLREGRGDGIRHCIRLNQGCLGRGSRGLAMSCTVNPLAGREIDRPERPPAAAPRRWIVVGGGPAGMRAAVELASDGHAVSLFERDAELGGQLRLAREVPGRDSVGLLIEDLRRDLFEAGVEVRLGSEVTGEMLRDERPDGIVVATGAAAPRTAAPVDAFTAVADPAALGRRIAVIDTDGTAYASGIVLTLLEAVDELTLITPFETAFPLVGAGYDRPLLFERLAAHSGFDRLVSQRIERVGASELELCDAVTGRGAVIEGVHAIVAIEPRAAVTVPGLDGENLLGTRIMTIGDAFSPRTIDAAIFEAVELAYDVAGIATLHG